MVWVQSKNRVITQSRVIKSWSWIHPANNWIRSKATKSCWGTSYSRGFVGISQEVLSKQRKINKEKTLAAKENMSMLTREREIMLMFHPAAPLWYSTGIPNKTLCNPRETFNRNPEVLCEADAPEFFTFHLIQCTGKPSHTHCHLWVCMYVQFNIFLSP